MRSLRTAGTSKRKAAKHSAFFRWIVLHGFGRSAWRRSVMKAEVESVSLRVRLGQRGCAESVLLEVCCYPRWSRLDAADFLGSETCTTLEIKG